MLQKYVIPVSYVNFGVPYPPFAVTADENLFACVTQCRGYGTTQCESKVIIDAFVVTEAWI